jgi:hypothetical protein
MANFIEYNANYQGKRVGDCTVRAISKALNQSWQETYSGIAIQGMLMANMPSGNAVWGAYLRHKGFERHIIPNTCPDCYTLADFCKDYPKGTYVVCFDGHVATVIDGKVYDSWDSRNETPIYYWSRKED